MQTIRKNFFSVFLQVTIVLIVITHCGFALITRISCSASDKGTCIEPFCYFTKNDTKEEVIANYGCRELSKPLTQINVQFKVYAKMSSQYFQVAYFPKFDYCKFIETYDKENFLYHGVKLLKNKLPESIHECPYSNRELQVNNLTLTDADFGFVPAGKYKVICTFSDDDDSKILRMTTYFNI